MRRLLAGLVLIATGAATSEAQVFDLISLDRLNGKLRGHVVDHTQNHGADRRIFSPILGRPRDLYVYLPPGYDPSLAYPLIVFLHGADVDEHDFLDPGDLEALDRAMACGEIPPAVVAAPDGTYGGLNRVISTHSLWVNGLGGRFEDHVVAEVVPYLMRNYSIRPERQAHALLGVSAGGYGAMSIALKHRDLFGVGRDPGRAAQHALRQLPGPLWRRLRPGQLPHADRIRPRHGHRPLLPRAARPARQDVPAAGVWRRPRLDRPGHAGQPGRPARVDRPPPRRAGDLRQLSRPSITSTSTPRPSPSPGSPPAGAWRSTWSASPGPGTT